MAGETNRLVSLARSILPRTDLPEYDLLVASGEQVSVALLSMALRKRGIIPAPMLATHAGIRTTEDFSRASILSIAKENIVSKIEAGMMPVIAGFQGVTEEGYLTTIGRGGSDTSAVAVAAAIQAESCVIYTDVEGVFTTDPRLCKDAHIISHIHFDEMLEMASQGSKVLHIRSVQLAAKMGVKLIVKSSFNDGEGTTMTHDESLEGELVTGIAASSSEVLFTVGPFPKSLDTLSRIFSNLAERRVNVDIISQSFIDGQANSRVQFTVNEEDALIARETLAQCFPDCFVESRNDVAKISIVGVGMRVHPGVAALMFSTLTQEKVEVLLVTTSEIKVACLIPRNAVERATQALHKAFAL
jgi:aspartate kinase